MTERLHSNGYSWGRGSLAMLAKCCPDLQAIADLWIELLDRTPGAPDVSIVQTDRSQVEAQANASSGKGIDTSKHVGKRYPDGKARALDFKIVGPDPYNRALLDIAIGLFLQAADTLRIPARSGGDWDMDGIPTEKDRDEVNPATGKKLIADHVHGEVIERHELRYGEFQLAMRRRAGLRAAGERYPR